MLPLSFSTDYDGITVLKQSANRAVILANILFYAPHAGFPHVPCVLILMTILAATKIVFMQTYIGGSV